MISKISTGLAVLAFALQAAAQTSAWGQCGGAGFTGNKTCVSGFTCKFSNEWYSQCVPGSGPAPSSSVRTSSTSVHTSSRTSSSVRTSSTSIRPSSRTPSSIRTSSTSVRNSAATSAPASSTTHATTVATTATQSGGNAGGIITPTKVSTVFPEATGSTLLPAPTVIRGVFNGKMARFDRDSVVCQGQKETGEKDTIFILEEGATLANVIIGKNQAEGVHCRGSCTLINVWHEDVCEDGVTFKQSSGTSYVIGGGARNADDKILQFNGKGKVVVKHFYATNFGKLMRHCGTCGVIERHTEFDGIVAEGGGVVVGINTNAGDTSIVSNSCLKSGTKYGDRYNAVSSGEPSKIGSCPSGTSCASINNVSSC